MFNRKIVSAEKLHEEKLSVENIFALFGSLKFWQKLGDFYLWRSRNVNIWFVGERAGGREGGFKKMTVNIIFLSFPDILNFLNVVSRNLSFLDFEFPKF